MEEKRAGYFFQGEIVDKGFSFRRLKIPRIARDLG
jgi:hypothetical protein